MERALVVEDSKLFASLLRKRIISELNFDVSWVSTYAEAARLIEEEGSSFFIGLLDLNLPDAPDGEIVDLVLSKDIPSIVFTGNFSDDVRERMWAKGVIDYVLKESPHNIDYLVSLIRRIYRNKMIKVIVVDDSPTARRHLSDLLKVHQYQVVEASDGNEAMNRLNTNPDIKLVITDYNMPNMDGFQLTEAIRDRYRKEELAIIGMSTQGNNTLSARFIKNGANDFINKPFLSEEFYCRVTQNIEMIEQVMAIKDSSNKDYLTDLYNRRYFFEVGEKLYANSKRGNVAITIAMIDIDYFKRINDTYGHEAGDEVLKKVASLLKKRIRESDVVARFGGEEFCILATNMEKKRTFTFFEELRRIIWREGIKRDNKRINVTVSIGVCDTLMDSLDEMIKQADCMLYDAKRAGRNRVKIYRRAPE